MKKLFVCLCLVTAFLFSNAQSSVAIIGGLQKASVSPDFLLYPDTLRKVSTSKTGVVLGLVATIPLKKNFYLRTGVIYSSKGSNWTQFYDTTNLYASTKDLPSNQKIKPYSVNTKLNVNFIDIPFNLVYKLRLKKSSSLTVGVGPQASIFYNGSSSSFTINVRQDSTTARSVRTSIKTVENNDLPIGVDTKKYRVIHFGMNAFIGVEFNRVFFNLNYAKDINEFYEEEGRRYKNKTIGLSIGVFLGQRNVAGNTKTVSKM